MLNPEDNARYKLTVLDDPGSPILLTQEEFDLILAHGALHHGTQNTQEDTTGTGDYVNFATLETVDEGSSFYWRGKETDPDTIQPRFEAGLQNVIISALQGIEGDRP